MNLFSAASLPVSFCTCLLFVGSCILIIAKILSGFASIPLAETRQTSNFPFQMPKMHLFGFNFRPLFCRFVKVSLRSSMCVCFLSLLTTMSVTYTTKFLPFYSWKTPPVILEKVGPAFRKPPVCAGNSKCPRGWQSLFSLHPPSSARFSGTLRNNRVSSWFASCGDVYQLIDSG